MRWASRFAGEAREQAQRDADEDAKFYASLDTIVEANLPACEPANGSAPILTPARPCTVPVRPCGDPGLC
jgi:hypothetical protein